MCGRAQCTCNGGKWSDTWEDAGTRKGLEVMGNKPTVGEKKAAPDTGAGKGVGSVEGTGQSDWTTVLFCIGLIHHV